MTVANKIAMDVCINSSVTCPAWLVWTMVGVAVAFGIATVVTIILVNK